MVITTSQRRYESQSMKKSLTLSAIIIATIVSVYALTYFMKMDRFTYAWALNFLLMLWVSAFVEALKSPLTSAYYHEKKWERKGRLYELIGINYFRKLLVLIGWEKVIRRSTPIEKSTAALMNLHHQTKKSELGHVIILYVVMGFTIVVAFQFGVLKSIWLLSLNILLNLYPVLLQRYNRPRIQRAINLSQRRTA
jgi:hypothetical protein